LLKIFLNINQKIQVFFFEDARTYVKKCEKKYDLIILDLFADGDPEHLTTKEFYQNLDNCLNDNGVVISNTLMDFSNELALNSVLSTFSSQFDDLHYFHLPDAEVNNLYIIAGKNGTSKRVEGFKVDLDYIPRGIKPTVIQVLKMQKNLKKKIINIKIFYMMKKINTVSFLQKFYQNIEN
jgi:hypothetical protein